MDTGLQNISSKSRPFLTAWLGEKWPLLDKGVRRGRGSARERGGMAGLPPGEAPPLFEPSPRMHGEIV